MSSNTWSWSSIVRSLALFVGCACAAAPGLAQSDLLEEAESLYSRDQAEAGLAKMKELLASQPSQEEAFELVGQVSYSFWLDMLLLGGEHEQVATRFLELSQIEERERRYDREAIRSLVADLSSDDLSRVNAARLALTAEHGPYAVPYILQILSQTSNTDYRVNLLFTLTEMGPQAVLPLIEALHSDDVELRSQAIIALGNIGDSRAVGPLLRHAELHDLDATERSLLDEALGRIGATTSSARDALLATARGYLANDPRVVRDLTVHRPVFRFEGGEVVYDDVPLFLFHLIEAEKFCYDALDVAPEDEEVMATLARSMLEQQAALETAEEAGADVSAARGRVTRAMHLATAGGSEVMREALRSAMREASPEVVVEAIDSMAETLSPADIRSGDHPVLDGLDSDDKRVRYRSAIAIAGVSPNDLGPRAAEVVDTLIQAVGEESVRTVLVIDDRDDERNRVLSAARDLGLFAIGADTGVAGIARARSLPGADLFVVRAGLSDLTTDRMLRELASDFRTREVPVVLHASQANRVEVTNHYGTGVAGVMVEVDPDLLNEALGEDTNENRKAALRAASDAANALLLVAHAESADLSGAVPALTGTLDKPDSVRLPAARALGYIGDPSAIPGLVRVFANTGNAADVRAAAAVAIGQISAATGSLPGDAFQALMHGIGEDDGAVAQAAARALGLSALTSEQRRELLANQRPTTAGLGEG